MVKGGTGHLLREMSIRNSGNELSVQEAIGQRAQELIDCIKSFRSQLHDDTNVDEVLRQEVHSLVDRLDHTLSDGWQSIQGTEPAQIYDITYKKLYEVPFYQVSSYWVRLYVLACLVCSLVPISSKDALLDGVDLAQQALNRVDYAIIMSGGVFWPQLVQDFVQTYTQIIERIANDNNLQLSRQFGFQNDKFVNDPVPELPYPTFPVAEVPSSRNDEIHRLFEQQLHHHRSLGESRPFKIQGLASEWPAVDLWNHPSYILFRSCSGRRLVPVEVGQSYTSKDWGQQIISMGEFLASFTNGARANCEIPEHEDSDKEDDKIIYYLAQFDLFTLIPSLRQDVLVPDWCYMFSDKDVIVNTWFGSANTISPAHTDPHNNILVQLVGYKYVRLYPPSYSDENNDKGFYMYPRGKEIVGPSREINMSNTCSVDVCQSNEFPDGVASEKNHAKLVEKYPKFPWLEGYLDVILGPGDALFIPRGWWHYVRSCTISFSVSYWF